MERSTFRGGHPDAWPKVLPDALAAVEASAHDLQKDDRETVVAFLKRYEEVRAME